MEFILIFVGFAVGFVFGMLFQKNNVKKANEALSAMQKMYESVKAKLDNK